MSESTGKPKEASVISIFYRSAARLSQTVATEKELLDLASQLGEWRVHRSPPRVEDNFPLRTQLIEPQADCVADTPFDAISRHRAAQPPCSRDSVLGSGFGLMRAHPEYGAELARVT